MQKGYFRAQELKSNQDAAMMASIANGKLEKKNKELFTAADFLPSEIKEINLDDRKALAEAALERSKRFDHGVKIEDYGGY